MPHRKDYARKTKGPTCCGVSLTQKDEIQNHFRSCHPGWAQSGIWVAYVWHCRHAKCRYWDAQKVNWENHENRKGPNMKHEEHLNIVEFSISSDNGQPTFKSGDISMVSKFIIAPSSISSETPVSGEDPPNIPQQSPEPELNRNIDQSTLASGSLPTVHTQTPSEEYPPTTFHEHDSGYDTPDQAARSRDHTSSPAPSPQKSLPVSKFSELAGWNIQKR